MAKGRMLNRSVTIDVALAEYADSFDEQFMKAAATLFHHRLIPFLDINGNVFADPFWLKATLFPLDSWITPDHCREFARRLPAYKSDDGQPVAILYTSGRLSYLHFPKFRKNQPGLRPEKEKAEYPEYNQEEAYSPPVDCPQPAYSPSIGRDKRREVEEKRIINTTANVDNFPNPIQPAETAEAVDNSKPKRKTGKPLSTGQVLQTLGFTGGGKPEPNLTPCQEFVAQVIDDFHLTKGDGRIGQIASHAARIISAHGKGVADRMLTESKTGNNPPALLIHKLSTAWNEYKAEQKADPPP